MPGNYYSQDYDYGNEDRLVYFDNQFLSLAKELSDAMGITLSQYLSQIKNKNTFKEILKDVFSQDPSLSNYVDGMKPRDFDLFFNRQIIQGIIETDIEETEEFINNIPLDVKQISKKTTRFFKAKYKEKKTNKLKKTIGKEIEVLIKGKKYIKFRDSKGRFVKKI